MAATTTLASLIESVIEDTALGIAATIDAANTTTTFTQDDAGKSELRGPFTGKKFAIGTPVLVLTETSGTDIVGQTTYVSNWVPSTGVLTVSPAVGSATDATKIAIVDPEIGHPDRIIEAINRGLKNHCCRWMKVVLGYVPDGELLATTVADFWTASAGTASYVSLSVPEVAGQRVLNITHSSAANATSNTIPARSSEVWHFETAIRAASDGDTATFTVQDITNTASITVTYEEGSGSTTSRAFVTQKGTFTVPSTCDRIAFRIAVSGSGTMTAQMAPIFAAPKDARSFPFTNRVLYDRIGNFYYSTHGSVTGPDERSYSDPITTHGRTATFSDDGDHMVVSFNFTPTGPVFYDELVFGSALSAMADTTVFPPDQVILWAKYELYRWLYNNERRQQKTLDNGTPKQSVWRTAAREAKREAERSAYEPNHMTLSGRR